MANLTYTGTVVSGAGGEKLPTMTTAPAPNIVATLTDTDNGSLFPVTFKLVEFDTKQRRATIIAVLPSPVSSPGYTITGITPTFTILSASIPTTVSRETPAVEIITSTIITTGAVISITATSSTASISTDSSLTNDSSTGVGVSSTPASTGTESSISTSVTSIINSSTSTGSNTASTAASKSNGFTGGAVAGVVVGCLVAAIIVVSLIAFCIRRHRARSRISGGFPRKDARSREFEGEALVLSTGLPKTWQTQLPQPESDQTISRLANRTLDEIELFVENFYIDQPMKEIDRAIASNMSHFSSPHFDRSPADMLQTSRSPLVLLKHYIAYYLLLKIDPARDDSTSLLRREFVVPLKGDPQVQSQLRVRTAQSLPDTNQDERYLKQRERAAKAIAEQIERAFQPWSQGAPENRATNLKGLLTHLSELGNRLFAQPATFEWRWGQDRTLSQGQIVMLPGLEKTTNSEAVLLDTPISLAEARLGNVLN